MAAAFLAEIRLMSFSFAPTGGDAPRYNMMPDLRFYFCIALQGGFPSRS